MSHVTDTDLIAQLTRERNALREACEVAREFLSSIVVDENDLAMQVIFRIDAALGRSTLLARANKEEG